MSTFTQTVEIDVDPSDFDDDELIEELQNRGYIVEKEPELINIAQHWQRGQKKEALILLEREVPELRGISQLVN